MSKEVSNQDGAFSEQNLTYEILETVCRKVHMRHRCEYPNQGIAGCLLETSQCAGLTLVLNCVQFHPAVGQLALLGSQPLRSEREVWQNEIADESTTGRVMLVIISTLDMDTSLRSSVNSHDKSDHALEDK